jgi:hypothetical protein
MAKKSTGRRQRLLGRSFPTETAIIILRDTGQVLNRVDVLEKRFSIKTPDLGVLKIETRKVRSIVYRNLPTYPTDVLRTVNGSEFNGVVLNDPIKVNADDLGGNARLPRAKVLSIIW